MGSVRKRLSVVGVCFAAALAHTALPGAHADTSDPGDGLPTTVASTVLPSPQIDGVAWATKIIGSTVFVGGHFSSARAFGNAAGTGEQARKNFLAFNLTTGALLPFAPSFNGDVRAIEASPDGKTVYVGGVFDEVDGKKRYRLAAFDVATGALKDFAPVLDAKVHGIAVHESTIYVGGVFQTANGQPRSRLAAYNTQTGALLPWNPGADDPVLDVVVSPDGSTVVAGGGFTTLAGRTAYGWGAINATTGAGLPWKVNQVIDNHGDNAAIYDLEAHPSGVYATGYKFDAANDFEGIASATWSGELRWIKGCKGDSYGASVMADVVYSVHHSHDCSPIGGKEDSEPSTYQRADAVTANVSPFGRINSALEFSGYPAPELLHWWPEFEAGSVTGLNQASWAVDSHDGYLVMVGEFPRVNGVKQQGIVVMARQDIGSGEAPVHADELNLRVTNPSFGVVKADFAGIYDRDSKNVEHILVRDGVEVATVTVKGNTWWNRPAGVVEDKRATAGEHTYWLKVRDADGGESESSKVTITVDGPATEPDPEPTTPDDGNENPRPDLNVGPDPLTSYRDEVAGDKPLATWSLGDASGDATSSKDGWNMSLGVGAVRGLPGAVAGGDKAVHFVGEPGVPASMHTWVWSPDVFSMEMWVRTSSTKGGTLMNFGTSDNGTSRLVDRALYLTGDGRVHFGALAAGGPLVVSSEARIADGEWHHVAVTVDKALGTKVFVDGVKSGESAQAVPARGFFGYWKLGGDDLSAFQPAPEHFFVTGTLDEVAVYDRALTDVEVARHMASRNL